MDSLETLFEKEQYELILKITKDNKDAESIFYRVMSFANLFRLEEAIINIENNREILEKYDLKILIKIHIEFLIMLHDFDKAFDELSYYKELPYESQEVEELLAALPKYIRKEEKEYYQNKTREVTPEEINRILKKGSIDEIIGVLDLLKKYDITPYLDNLKNLLINYPKQSVRAFTLLLLKYKNYEEELDYLSIEGRIKVNLKEVEPPFETDRFKSMLSIMFLGEKDTALANNANQILSSYILLIYPKLLDVKEDLVDIIACKELARKYLTQETNLLTQAKLHKLNIDDLKKSMKKIEDLLNDF